MAIWTAFSLVSPASLNGRKVVANHPVPAVFALAFSGLTADLARMFEIKQEQLFLHSHRALVRFVNGWIVIQVFVQEFAQPKIQSSPLRAVLDERSCLQT